MRTYIFTTEYKKKTICTIYRVKNNMPIYIGEVEFSMASTKDAVSEVFNKLVQLKEVPKSLLKLSQCSWRSAGYYCTKVEDNGVRIIEI